MFLVQKKYKRQWNKLKKPLKQLGKKQVGTFKNKQSRLFIKKRILKEKKLFQIRKQTNKQRQQLWAVTWSITHTHRDAQWGATVKDFWNQLSKFEYKLNSNL